MNDMDTALAAMDVALARLERAIELGAGDSEQLPNLVALLALNVRAQHKMLRTMVEHFRVS